MLSSGLIHVLTPDGLGHFSLHQEIPTQMHPSQWKSTAARAYHTRLAL